jgi:teichuronic acid exporter
MSLRNQALSGVSWTFIEQFGSKAINFIVQIILARLIAPEEFGLLGMILVFSAIGNSLSDSGMTQSLIRSDNPDEEDFSTVFTLNLCLSLFLYLVFYFSAPFISDFYDQPRLTGLIRAYCLVIIISSLFVIQKARLTYDLNFKSQMRAELPALFISGFIGIAFAYNGYGVWALIYMQIISGLSLALIYFYQTRWIPTFKISRIKLREHLNFGYKLAISGIISRVIKNIFPMVIGKYFSAAMVGYYTRAFTMKELPVLTISNTLDKVVYPLLAKIKNNEDQLKKAYQKIQILSLFVLSTIMLLLILTAHPLFGLLLGEEWLPAVPFFQLLCITGIFYPINKYNANLLKVKGRTDLYLKMAVIVNITLVLGIVFTVRYGVIPLILAQVFNSLLAVFINIYYANKFISYPYKEQFGDAFKTIFPGLLTFIVIFGMAEFSKTFGNFHYFAQLMIYTGLFTLGVGSLHFIFRTRSLQEIQSVIKLIKDKKDKNS